MTDLNSMDFEYTLDSVYSHSSEVKRSSGPDLHQLSH